MTIRRVATACALLLLLVSCGGNGKSNRLVSRDPISVRGWVVDVEGSPTAPFRTAETEAARKTQLYQAMNIWVENAPYVSGGLIENGSFLLLDVPPGKVTISFQAPGAPSSRLVLDNVPGNADVFVPSILLTRDGLKLLEPNEVKVRLATKIRQPRPTGRNATVNGQPVPIVETPIAELADRHEWPTPPGVAAPVATVK